MPKYYWCCPTCHTRICKAFAEESNASISCYKCKNGWQKAYKLQCDSWWELLYLTIRDIIRRIN
jgi:hypothetical protein